MCYECNVRNYFNTVLKMAYKCLPSDREALDSIAAECEIRWKAEVDNEMAYTIITGSTSRRKDSTGMEGTITDIESTEDDIFSHNTNKNIIASDAKKDIIPEDIKEILARHSTGGRRHPHVDTDDIIDE